WFELAIQVYDVRRLVERTYECVERPLRLALFAKRRVIEPADAKAQAARHAEEILDRKGETLFADRFRRSLEIGKPVLVRFLVSTNQKVRELPPGRARLRQQFGYRGLQKGGRKEETRFERYAFYPAAPWCGLDRFFLQRFVEKPADLFLEDS